jgi:hypothetical protein
LGKERIEEPRRQIHNASSTGEADGQQRCRRLCPRRNRASSQAASLGRPWRSRSVRRSCSSQTRHLKPLQIKRQGHWSAPALPSCPNGWRPSPDSRAATSRRVLW